MGAAHPDIFQYADFRAFLGDWFAARKAKDPKLSHRFIHRAVGATSAGWFADVLAGRISLTDRFLPALTQLMGLKGAPARYFEALVRCAQAGSLEERERHLDSLVSLQGPRMDTVSREQFEFYGRWHHAALRELLCVIPFKGAYDELGARLVPPLPGRQAKASLELMQRLDLVAKDAQGMLKPKQTLLRKDPAFKALNIHRYLGAFMRLGIEALTRFPKEERDVSCLTLALSEEAIAEAKQELDALRKRLLEKAAKETRPTKVVQCNLQFFPLSK